MTIWQVMKGTYDNPKLHWNRRDLLHQHFAKDLGQDREYAVKQGDLMLIYWLGQKLYMGLQEAAEDGPRELSQTIPGAKDWLWGLRVAGHWWIRDPRNGIPFGIAGSHIQRRSAGRLGLFRTNNWPPAGRDWIIREIKNRGEDPRKWSWSVRR